MQGRGVESLPRARDAEHVKIGPGEANAAWLAGRHRQRAVDSSVGSVAHDAPGTPVRTPHAAVGVDGCAVRKGALGRPCEYSAWSQGSLRFEQLVFEDRTCRRIRKIQPLAIRAVAQAVRDANLTCLAPHCAGAVDRI